MGRPIPSRRFGGRELSVASELSRCNVLDGGVFLFGVVFSVLVPSDCDEDDDKSDTLSSCMVAAMAGTWPKLRNCDWVRGPLQNDQRCGRISLGIPPPWSEMRMITC